MNKHTFLPLIAALMLSACGGWFFEDDEIAADVSEDVAASGATALALTCNTAAYVAGSVELPTATQLATYAGSYDGDEGQYGSGPGAPFVKSASATLLLGANGSVSYKGTSYAVTSVCVDKTAGPYGRVLYIVAGVGHLDISDNTDPTLGQAWGISLVDGTTIFSKAVKR